MRARRKGRPFGESPGYDVERVARAYGVPYWLVSDRPRPSWFERPAWRLRALWWRWR